MACGAKRPMTGTSTKRGRGARGQQRRCGTGGRWLRRLALGGAIGAGVWFASQRAAAQRAQSEGHGGAGYGASDEIDGAASASAGDVAPEILPGDELVPHADIVATRSVDIAALPEEVWPWLAQLGQDKAGFYSWTALENLAGIDMPEVHRIVPEWQGLSVGDPVKFSDGLAAIAAIVEPPYVLVLHGDPQALAAGEAPIAADPGAGVTADPEAPAPVDAGAPAPVAGATSPTADADPTATAEIGEGDPGFAFTWAFVIEPTETGSRLTARERFAWLNTRGRIGATIGSLLSRPMSAKMMSTIKRLAEQN